MYLATFKLNKYILQFAVVDIETTGGYAAENGITEISVFVTDGVNISDTFYALINPETPIPPFIETLTGITNERVANQPVFEAIAGELFGILKDKIFVAHNVNFDFSFLKFHFHRVGFDLDNKKLCTIRLARKVIPGLRGYGLDRICSHLKIDIEKRHSAAGDAYATTVLFHRLLEKGGMEPVHELMKSSSGNMSLPPNIGIGNVNGLVQRPGVYYFHDKHGKIIYVGKAKNIRRRVRSHFTNNKPTRQKQEFLKKIYHISYRETATELMAFILEGIEIKKIWPQQNTSQKFNDSVYGLYTYVDSKGLSRLFIEKKLKHLQPVYTFSNLTDGYALLRKLIKEYSLCPHLCFLTPEMDDCCLDDYHCKGACKGKESSDAYNERVQQCLDEFKRNLPTFAIVDRGIEPGEKSCVLVEEGRFVAMGCVSPEVPRELHQLKSSLRLYADNAYVRSLIFKYAERHPYQILPFSGISLSR